jgi:hypothetical protein
MRRTFAAVAALALAAALVSGCGDDARSEPAPLVVGDCLNASGQRIDCNDANAETQVRYTKDLSSDYDSGTDFPGDPALTQISDDFCHSRFYFYPSASSWDAGDRQIVCFTPR